MDIIENTYFEAFDGIYIRAIITAEDEKTLYRAAYDSTSTPGAVIGRVEGGVEKFIDKSQTPDGRIGVIVQYWFGLDDLEKFELELSYRLRQDVLTKPFTSVFAANDLNLDNSQGSSQKSTNPAGYIGMMKQVGHCGDGYEWKEELNGREIINVPIAVPDFKIESKLPFYNGIMGANFWYMCKTKEAVINAGNAAIEAINEVDGVICPFDICSAASKVETNYPWIGPTTNHPYCPSLKSKLANESKVPENANYIPEIVINGVDMASVNKAMKVGIDACLEFGDVIKISAGNYNGALGEYKVNLTDII
ncbi:MAG: formylmethanofuran--tetrahydromethanopterin N-formyltransferase [Methanobacteriaceae archaeon]